MPAPTRTADRQSLEAMDQIIRDAGGDPESGVGMRVRDMIHTSLKLLTDGADDGEVKLLSRSFKELRYALKVFRPYQEARKITIFGSARTPPGHPDYEAALGFSKEMAALGWMVITGAGDGIMRAGHGGAGKEKSFGVAIRLPFETNANEFIVGDPKLITFRYFFTRKLMFIWQAHAVALFPGGFGTQDEGFEALTLVQTGKAPMMPIVLVDRPGGDYWRQWDVYVRKQLLEQKLISAEDLNLYLVTDEPRAAVEYVQRFYRNYHSQRFANDTLILRVQRPISEEQLDALNVEFKDLVKEGRITQASHDADREHPDLARLQFVSTKRAYGRVRLLIDRINGYDLQNHPDADQRAGDTGPKANEDLADQTASLSSSADTDG